MCEPTTNSIAIREYYESAKRNCTPIYFTHPDAHHFGITPKELIRVYSDNFIRYLFFSPFMQASLFTVDGIESIVFSETTDDDR